MNRRESLLTLSTLAGHALFPSVLARFGVVSDAMAAAPQAWHPELLSEPQGAILAEIVETILPETDTPGARAARVHVFVDLALSRCTTPAQQQAAVNAIDALGATFLQAEAAARAQRLSQMPAEPLALLRELTLLGYFTSEPGATRALAYVAVPGAYRGCVDLLPGQKAWATR